MRGARSGGRGVLAVVLASAMVWSASASTVLAGAGGPGGSAAQTVTVARRSDGTVAMLAAPVGRSLTAASQDDPGTIARRFLDANGVQFGALSPARDLAEARRTPGVDGRVTVRFDQSLGGVPVLGAEVAITVDPTGAVRTATGVASAATGVDLVPSVPADTARATALTFASGEDRVAADQLIVDGPTLLVYDPSILDSTDPSPVRLVWRSVVHTAVGDVNRVVLVDAHDGTVALHWNDTHTTKNRTVCDNNNVPAGPHACLGAILRIEGQAPVSTGDTADVNHAFDFTGTTYDFYFSRFQRDSLDGAGITLKSIVNFCTTTNPCPYDNAFWSGLPSNGGDGAMVFGDGYPSGLDIVGHELTHGVTEATSGLLYIGDSGAINESLSDVMGELIQRSAPAGQGGSTTDQWQLAENLPPAASAPLAPCPLTGNLSAFRSMKDPPLCGDPDRVRDSHWSSGAGDNFGVHRNSGVGNKAAYLITDGDTFNGQTVTGLGIDKTALIYYELMTALLGPASDYRDLAVMLPQACQDLVSAHTTLADCAQVSKAVLATEMAQLPVNQVPPREPAPTCASSGEVPTSIFQEDFSGGLTNWTVTSGGGSWSVLPNFQGRGVPAAYSPGTSGVSDAILTKKVAVAVPTTGSIFISLRHWYGFEFDNAGNYDGGRIEFSTDNGLNWTAADPTLPAINGGDLQVFQGFSNPIGGGQAFVRVSRRAEVSRYDLSSLHGHSVLIRFRQADDNGVASYGWGIEQVAVYQCFGTPAVAGRPTAVPGDASVALSWAAPGGGPTQTPSSYVITPFVGAVAQPTIDTGSTALTFPVGGATNGTTYTFTVAAKNPAGTGPSSPASDPVTPGPPTAPTSVVASAGNAQAVLTWSSTWPASGSPITSYSITPVKDGVVQAPVSSAGSATSATVGGLINGSTYTFQVRGVNSVGTGSAGTSNAVTPAVGTLTFTALTPARLFDTRQGEAQGLVPVVKQRYGGANILRVKVTGVGSIPQSGVGAVSLNVTVVQPAGGGFVTVFPCGDQPGTANVNYVANQIVPNAVISPVSAQGEVCFFSLVDTDLVADVNGWLADGSGFTGVTPARLFDTRQGEAQGLVPVVKQRYGGANVLRVKVTGVGGVPGSGVAAVSLNVTAVQPVGGGFVTVFPCGDQPGTANVNYVKNQIVPNAVIAPVSAQGEVCFFSLVDTDLVADVNGWFASGSGFTGVTPGRLFDTRAGEAQGLVPVVKQRYGGSNILKVKVTGVGGVPATGVGAVSLNVTAVQPVGGGFVTVFPCGDQPGTANVNYVANQIVPNAVIAPVSAQGEVCFFSLVDTDLVADVNGWFGT